MESNDMVFPDPNTLFLTLDNFHALKAAISDENLDKEIRYKSAIILADRIYDYNFYKNRFDFKNQSKGCKSPACIDKSEIYKPDTLGIEIDSLGIESEIFFIEDNIFSRIGKYKAPIEEIRLVLNQAVNQEEDLLYRFLAASSMPYIRETPSKDIINILAETFINPSGILNPDSEEDLENNKLITELALDSLQIFSKYAADSSYFEDVSSDLKQRIMSEDLAEPQPKPKPPKPGDEASGPESVFEIVRDFIKRKTKPTAIIEGTQRTSGRR